MLSTGTLPHRASQALQELGHHRVTACSIRWAAFQQNSACPAL